LRSGVTKVCPRCGEIRSLVDFKDKTLITGQGRFCRLCKARQAGRAYCDPVVDREYFYQTCSDCQNEVKIDSLTGEVKSNCTCGKYRKESPKTRQQNGLPNPKSRGYVSISTGKRPRRDDEPSRSDIIKLLSFSEDPEKYARGTSRAMEKVQYLESIKHKFSKGQLATYSRAFKKYNAALEVKLALKTTREDDHSAVLKEAFDSHRSVKIRYKDSWRTIDPYSLNNTYVVAYCHSAHDIRTFRVDRIQGAELSEVFNPDKVLQTTAQSRLSEAPNYRGDGGYRRGY